MIHQKLFVVITLILFLGIPCIEGSAQEPDDGIDPRAASIALITRTDADSVVLRWAPSTPGGWSTANRIGYIIERVRVVSNGSFDRNAYERLTPEPLHPWSLAEWRSRSNPDNHFAAIAAQALYGRSFVPRPMEEENINILRNAADEFRNRYSFSLFAADNDAHTAEGLALRHVDRNVSAGEKYIYRIFLAEQDSFYHVDTAYAVVDVDQYQPSPPPYNLTAEGLDGVIVLRWEDIPGGYYSGYFIYRSEDYGITFTQLNRMPFITATPDGALNDAHPRYDDTTVVNYKRYRYTVRGVTPFAELSLPAEVEAYSRDLTPPPAPVVENPEQTGPHHIQLTWDMRETSGDLSGFVIARSSNSLGGYQPLFVGSLPPYTRTFVDTTATSGEPYYIIGAVDTAGNVAPSLPVYGELINETPPSIPTGFTGRIDTNGVVHLRWDIGPEEDLMGYRILWANDPDHEFTQRTNIVVRDTMYTDTINVNTLTRNIYYRLVAVNNRYNHSDPSPVLTLRRSDIIPPEPSVFTDVFVTDSSVVLMWNPSTSDDVMWQVIYRREEGAPESELTRIAFGLNRYTDTDVRQNMFYTYSIVVLDSSGLRSERALPVRARPYDTGVRPSVERVRVRFDERDNAVVLEWDYTPVKQEEYFYIIYRAAPEYELRQYRSVESGNRIYRDGALVGSGEYTYAVQVVTRTGASSELSPRVSILME
jgi:uncharacterized protein